MSTGTWTKQLGALNGTFVPLLVGLIVVLVVLPIAETWPLGVGLIVSAVLVTGIFTVQENSNLRKLMVAILFLVLTVRWIGHLYGEQHKALVVVAHLAVGSYMAILAVICATSAIRRRQVDRDTVLGAVCGYVLIGYVFAFAYAVLGDVNPASFSSTVVLPEYDGARIGHGTPELLYYSFVTLSTVGYGDIIPANRIARVLAILEMLIGQLYLAAFVARLVGVMSARRIESQDASDGPSS